MQKGLEEHIQRYLKISEQDLRAVLDFFEPLPVKKKQNLFLEGKVCQHMYFVTKGCLRMFFINEKGVEQTTQFALENWWLADYFSFEKQTPSGFCVQAVEKSEVLAISFNNLEKLLQQFPAMEKYFRCMHQRANAASQVRIKNLYSLSREELYLNFSSMFPEFIQRIPQYLLASYLGFTPEYLSELRRKQFLKPV
ncbi:MAG: Crp/Fnr family transcriptional regulator [Chitinophagaceae bacterium]